MNIGAVIIYKPRYLLLVTAITKRKENTVTVRFPGRPRKVTTVQGDAPKARWEAKLCATFGDM